MFGTGKEITYSVKSEHQVDKFYEVTVEDKKIKNCTCQGWLVHKKCKHAELVTKTKLTIQLSPEEKRRQKIEASKYGKKIVPILSANAAYKTTDEKLADDKGLKEFFNKVS